MERRRKVINPDLISKLKSLGCKILKDEPLSKHTSFKIGGPADYFIEIPSKQSLQEFFQQVPQKKIFVLGGGTNILFDDSGFRGIVIKLSGGFREFFFDGVSLTCGAAVPLPLIVYESLKRNFEGLEFCAGIPGTAGGAVFGNAGTPQGDISKFLKTIEIFKDGIFEIINADEIKFEYRKNSIEGIICSLSFLLKKSIENDILKPLNLALERRKKSQPIDCLSAGCIFKNPPNISAGKLIDECGLKGKQIGGAQISQIHANFIINKGNAKANDVLELIEIAEKKVKEKFNISLETEIRIIK